MLITEKYNNDIAGVISCFDRVIIQGNILSWSHSQGMTSYLYGNEIMIFDYPDFAKGLCNEVRENAEKIAGDNNLKIEFIRKIKAFRKEDRIREIIKGRGDHPGLVHIFSAMESCSSYRPWHDKGSGRTFVRPDSGKCLHYYFYFIDREFGLCYLRVPTWCPFRLQFYFNGHNWLAIKLEKRGIGYVMRDNALLQIDDFVAAQEICDSFRAESLQKALDIFASRYCPVFAKYGLIYYWSIMQAEYSTDLVFKKQSQLAPLYESLVRTAIYSVKPDNIASFLGKKVDPRYQGEMGNNFNVRILGTRIKHQMGATSIKMYDKLGLVLRIETTTNNVSEFKIKREVQSRDGTIVEKIAPLKKNIYSLFALIKILKDCNRRYLEFISTFDDKTSGIKNLKKVSKTLKSNSRSYKGLNFFGEEDQKIIQILSRGEFNIKGFQNNSIRKFLPGSSSGSISRMFKRLKIHGLIKKVRNTYRYYLTKLGKSVISAGLSITEMLLIPKLTGLQPSFS